MLITQQFSWPAASWPTSSGAAAQYTLYSVYPGAVTGLQNVATTSASVTYDDSQALAFQVRPSSGGSVLPFVAPTSVGPECAVFVVGYVPCRAWLRSKVRAAISDRSDLTAGAVINWPDDEINGYINESLTELNLLFPAEVPSARITLLPPTLDASGNFLGVRTYTLPADFLLMKQVQYTTSDEKFMKFLPEKPYKGGETTAQSIMGYPKLGILLPPLAGRYYPGHYALFNGQISIDWDPAGDGDYLTLWYLGNRAYPSNDGDVLNVTQQDMELMGLYVQMKCWLRVSSQDSRLSRWTVDHKRDDQPILRQVDLLMKMYNQRIIDRRELRPKVFRLVRR